MPVIPWKDVKGGPTLITCLSPLAKGILADALQAQGLKGPLIANIRTFPECPEGVDIAFGRGKGAGGKRAPSPRNLFMGACIKKTYAETKRPVPEIMRECSEKWRQEKAAGRV